MITNNTGHAYYTKLSIDNSLICSSYTIFNVKNESKECVDFICTQTIDDTLLPFQSKVFYNKFIPENNIVKRDNKFLFTSELKDTVDKYKSIILTFDLNKMINCK